jgi:carbon monoxide dehydrogenase subunit G
MLKLHSKTGTVTRKQESVYNYISNFKNFAHLLPAERLHDIEISENTLQFSIDGLGHVGLKISEQHPFRQLVVNAMAGSPADFTFVINIADAGGNSSHVGIDLDANLNMFIEMMAKAPLQQFLDLMIDKLQVVDFAG